MNLVCLPLGRCFQITACLGAGLVTSLATRYSAKIKRFLQVTRCDHSTLELIRRCTLSLGQCFRLPLARFCSGRCALHAKSTFSLYASWILRSFFFGPNVHAKGTVSPHVLSSSVFVLSSFLYSSGPSSEPTCSRQSERLPPDSFFASADAPKRESQPSFDPRSSALLAMRLETPSQAPFHLTS